MKNLEKIIQPHIRGEYDKLKYCYAELIREGEEEGKKALNEVERGVYSDCFLLHARNLIDFLCNSKSKKVRCKCGSVKEDDDTLSTDFFQDKKPLSKKNEILNIEITKYIACEKCGRKGSVYKRINKQLSHITYSRISDQTDFFDKKKKPFKKIFINIEKEIKKFDDKINKEHPLEAAKLRIIDRI